MLWHAMPPELNTARLMAGAGPAPMLAAAAGWQTLSAALDAQAVELTARLNSLGEPAPRRQNLPPAPRRSATPVGVPSDASTPI